MQHLSQRLTAYLKSWYKTSTADKAAKGATVELTFEQFVSLFESRQLASLQRAIDAKRLRYLQRDENPNAYVLTWVSYAARSSNRFTIQTACVCSRRKSAKINLPKAGDRLRPSHCEAIAASMTGRVHSEETKAKISESSKGQPKAAWSLERRAARSRQRQAQEAAKRGEA